MYRVEFDLCHDSRGLASPEQLIGNRPGRPAARHGFIEQGPLQVARVWPLASVCREGAFGGRCRKTQFRADCAALGRRRL